MEMSKIISLKDKMSPELYEQVYKLFKEQNQEIIELRTDNDKLRQMLNIRIKVEFLKKKENGQLFLFNDAELFGEEAELVKEIEAIKEKQSIKTEEGKVEHKSKKRLVIDENKFDVVEKHITINDDSLVDTGLTDEKKILKYVPAKYYVLKLIFHKYKDKDGNLVVAQDNQNYILGKSPLSSELVNHIIYDKVCKSIPLYRQESDFLTKGVTLSRQTMSNNIFTMYEAYKPIVDKIKDYIIDAEITRSDETPLNVLEVQKKKPTISKTNTYIWLFSTGRSYYPALYYAYGPNRGREVLVNFFGNEKKRYLMSDFYSAYAKITNIENVYCLTHMRRKFYELIQSTTPDNHLSKVVVKEIAKIYALENVIQESYSGNYEKIKELRLEKIKPVFENLVELIEKHKDNVLPKSQLGKAINYFLSAKDGFAKVFDDGRLELDNNASERGIKSFVIGRKNWLFTNTEKGAKISCGLYSLINTAIANGLKAEDYLNYLADHLPYTKQDNFDYDSFLPWSEKLPKELKLNGK